MTCIGDIVKKELRQVRRDRKLLPMLLVMPVMQLIIFGLALSSDIKHVRTVVCDLDKTQESREIARELFSSEYFTHVGDVHSIQDVQQYLDSGRAAIALIIPHGYESDIRAGRTAQVQAILDGSDPNTGTVAAGYLGKAFQSRAMVLLSNRRAVRGLAAAGVDGRIRVWYNPSLESKNFLVPGVMALVVGLVAMVLTALAIAREREIGTIEQLIVTPIRPWELMAGKMLPYLLVGYADVTLILIVGLFAFAVPMRGSVVLLLGMSGLFLIASLGIGLLISTLARTQQQAMMAAVFFIMPSILLSGFIFPIESMPRALQLVTYVLPMRYFLIIVRGIFLKGSGIGLLWDQVVPLAVLGVAIWAVAVLRFRKTLD